MSEEQPKKPSQIVVGREEKPCGCVVTEYSDKVKQLAPCVPCGLAAAAQSIHQCAQALANAADAMLAVATTVRREQGAFEVARAAQKVAQGPRIVQ